VAEEGPDVSVVLARAGPVTLSPIHSWGQCNTTEGAWRARDAAQGLGAAEVRYDAGGVGAGVKGTWNTAERALPFRPVPVNFGGSPTDSVWPDGQTSAEKFLNLRAEMWWQLRRRFEKTYEYVTAGVQHPLDELISIPNHPQLIAELSTMLVERTETGKIKMESKEKMRRRGVKSPNFGDALALAYLGQMKRKFAMFA
jgi:phage terminase large subunit